MSLSQLAYEHNLVPVESEVMSTMKPLDFQQNTNHYETNTTSLDSAICQCSMVLSSSAVCVVCFRNPFRLFLLWQKHPKTHPNGDKQNQRIRQSASHFPCVWLLWKTENKICLAIFGYSPNRPKDQIQIRTSHSPLVPSICEQVTMTV